MLQHALTITPTHCNKRVELSKNHDGSMIDAVKSMQHEQNFGKRVQNSSHGRLQLTLESLYVFQACCPPLVLYHSAKVANRYYTKLYQIIWIMTGAKKYWQKTIRDFSLTPIYPIIQFKLFKLQTCKRYIQQNVYFARVARYFPSRTVR